MIEYNLDTEHSILHVQRKSATSVMRRNLETLGSRLYRDRGPRHACASHCLVGDRQQHAERVDAAAIHSPETVLIGCLAGPCGFGSLDCELIRDFSRCAPPGPLPDVLRVRLQQQSGLVADVQITAVSGLLRRATRSSRREPRCKPSPSGAWAERTDTKHQRAEQN
jgi:hypothetical protein